jgi:hypothetical protein
MIINNANTVKGGGVVQYHKKRSNNACAIPNIGVVSAGGSNMSATATGTIEPVIHGVTPQKVEKSSTFDDGKDKLANQEEEGDAEEWQQLQCPTCNKWFMNNFRLSTHQCNDG